MENAVGKKFIDVEQIIRSKNPRLLKIFPRFLLSYLKRIVHEEEINDFIDRHGHKKSLEFVDAIISDFHINVETIGLENVPASGGFIIAANHPLGGLDAIALMQALAPRRKDIKFIVNDILLQLKNLEELFMGVNKHGKNAVENLQAIDNLYASESGIMIFPAGLVSRRRNGEVKDLDWKKSFITKSKKYNKEIIPVFIEGRNTSFFYSLANFRSRIGIKANIEMLYLADEMYKQKGRTIKIIFGKEILPGVLDSSKTDWEWAQWIKEETYKLKGS